LNSSWGHAIEGRDAQPITRAGVPMHAKYMHELCGLLMYIPTYLWGFSIDPLSLVITLQNMKTLFCVFLHFRNLPELKLTWDFLGVNILS
jgi:hypothetical protein